MNVLLVGPYLGDFKEEILTFRPYLTWLTRVLKVNDDNVFVSSYEDTIFLYKKYNKIVFDCNIPTDRNKRQGCINTSIDKRQHAEMTKIFKDYVSTLYGYSKKDILHYNLNYNKGSSKYTDYNKIFEPIEINSGIGLLKKKDIVYIFSSQDDYEKDIYNLLMMKYNSSIVGIKIDDNFSYERIVNLISTAKVVICKVGFWTVVSNLQKVPVFSWGECVTQYKYGESLNLYNKESFVIPCENDPKKIIQNIDYFLKRKNVCQN